MIVMTVIDDRHDMGVAAFAQPHDLAFKSLDNHRADKMLG